MLDVIFRRLFRHCLKHEREYQSQHRLILSAIPRFIALKMVNDSSTQDHEGDLMTESKVRITFITEIMEHGDSKLLLEMCLIEKCHLGQFYRF